VRLLAMTQPPMTPSDFEGEFRAELVRQRLQALIVEGAKVSEAEARQVWEADRSKVRAGYLLVTAGTGETLDSELLRSVLRSVKELQAGMASDMLGTLDVRFQQAADQLHREGQEQAEAMLKVAEVLGAKIDRLSVRVDEGVGNDLQIVVDRMSDAIRAMSGVRRDIA